MKNITNFIISIYNQNYELIIEPSIVLGIYFILFTIIFLENGIIIASFLPGDSLLILVGVLTAKKVISYPMIIIILTFSASLGSWIAYKQGKFLKKNKKINLIKKKIPKKYYKYIYLFLYKYGFYSLIFSRFIGFFRTAIPMIAGIYELSQYKFQIFNWISGFIWILLLISLGHFFYNTTFFKNYEIIITTILTIFPIIVLSIGILTLILNFIKKKYIK
ncbi:MAG: DedA family protein [Arsenophonus sp.]|nr:MAG: DedA family protein [Arsenophonus sp.]